MPASTYLNRTHEVAKQLDEMQQCRRDARQISNRSDDSNQKSGGSILLYDTTIGCVFRYSLKDVCFIKM